MRRASTGSSGSCARPTASRRRRSISPPRWRPSGTCPTSPIGPRSSAPSRPPATTSARRRRAPTTAAPATLPRSARAEDVQRAREAAPCSSRPSSRSAWRSAIMVAMFVPQTPVPMETINWLALVPATFIQVWAGGRFYRPAWRAARHGTTNMDTLVAIGTTAAWAYSVVVTLFPDVIHEAGLHPETYFDSSTIIIGLVLLGRWLEARAKAGTTGAIRRLVALQAADRASGRRRPRRRRAARGRSSSATCSASGPATRSRSTASSSRARPRSTQHAHRRADAGRGRRRATTVIGGDPQHDRHVRHARHAGRPRHGARADRRARRAGPGQQGADPAPGRSDRRGVRAARPARGRRRRSWSGSCSGRSRG